MIDDLALRWIVTVLFAASIAGYGCILAAQHNRWTCTVNHVLHLAMSAAMIVMAWPAGMALPVVGPMIFFLLAAGWFVLAPGRVFSGIADRLINSYHAMKMTAMAWMYAVMSGHLPGQTCHPSGHSGHGSPGMQMAAMDMSGPEAAWTETEPGWIIIVNAIAAVGFAIAALYWLYRYAAERRSNAVSHRPQPVVLGPLCQALMAAGAALMFAVMV
ncbi:MAG: DUF5134 domain-containing protein [Mycolicibacter algericus]|uniref:DUF5134 domain-containing protein n=1 Tax=Mycolicibacter longobardus TaxID=1108812 RepID=A0A1X1Y688_9MYCO|nr:DUF5134 domain-containing protein [Mycolicibacter longobardus]ORW06588.1 hypothetical protein AWC16_01230 [Mycolicibacter longobardus]